MAFLRATSSEAGLRLLSYPLGSNIFTRTACCSVGVALPVYSTFKAIEKKDHKEQEKWLSYWAVYGCYSLAEICSDRLISWIPLYHHMKFAFLVWLQLPSIEGSRHLYEKYLRPVLVKHQTKMDQVVCFIYSKMINFMNSHQHEVDFLKTLLQRSVFAVYNMVKAVIHPASHRRPSAIKDEETMTELPPESVTEVCDPVMGDEGKLYVHPDLVTLYRQNVVPVASMLTPNQFEAEQLTGFRILSEKNGLEACNRIHAAGPSKVVITSTNIGDELFLLGSHQKVKGKPAEQFKIVIPKIPAYFTGTGDLMTALLLGWSNKYPDNLEKASELAVSSLQAVLQRTLADYKAVGFDPQSSSLEIRLIQSQEDIRNPRISYKAEKYS